jgi:hypothetical protein
MYYKDMAPLLPVYIAGCPDFLVEKAIKDATLSFCARSAAYRVTLDPAFTIANYFEYEVDLPRNTTLVDLHVVVVGGTTLVPETEEGAAQINAKWRTEAGTPQYYIRPNNNMIYLVPVPLAAGDKIEITASVKPTLASAQISDDFVEDHVDGIMAGALSLLYDTPDMPWSNPQRAMKQEALFASYIQNAKNNADGRKGPTHRRVRYGGL